MRLAVLSASLATWLIHPGPAVAQEPVRLLTQPQAEVVEMGPHHRVWSRAELVPDGVGGWCAEERRVTELATGLGRWDEGQRAYVPARAAFEVTESGHVIARETAHQLILPPDLSESSVDMLAPDGARLRWQLIGLAIIDRANGQSVLLGEAQPSAAQWLGEQEVLYPNALSGIAADVRYRLTLDGLEQDLILREQVAPELVADLGLNPGACRLMVLTEFVSFPEETTTERRTLGEVLADGTVGTDEEVSFGAMRIGAGRAFGLEEAEGSWLRVAKSWERLDGRQVLVESVDYANPAIEVRVSGSRLHDLRLAHASTGLKFSDSSAGNHQVSHVQMVHCNSALIVDGNGALSNHVALRNVLIDRATYGLYGSSFQVTGEHLTAHECAHLAYNSSTSYVSGLSLTNSLLVAVTTNGTVSLGQACCQWPGSSNGVFQTVGAGGFYLADGAYREAGTTNIDAALAADLKRKTTYPPLVWSNAVVTTDAVLSPQAGRDTDLPDLGYHYDPIDHAVSSFTVTNAFDSVALTNANAAVVNDHNGYLGLGQAQLPGSGGGDQVLSSFTYTNLAVWPSWRFYQVTTDLINVGSCNATNAGLYHFTTQISQAKETDSVVDIGFHYVAVDTATGLPLDFDEDGVSDHFEDRDGNGTVGSGETDWQRANPGSGAATKLTVFTPLAR